MRTYDESIDGMKHADKLADRILFLEYLANSGCSAACEAANRSRYPQGRSRARAGRPAPLPDATQHYEKARDYVRRDLFLQIPDSEDERADTQEKQFGMIARMGLQNYTQLSSEPVED